MSGVNEYCPVALILIISKCFARLVMVQIKGCLSTSLDPIQFAYHHKWSTEDTISSALHLALMNLELKNNYMKVLFVDVILAFNAIVPQKFIRKLDTLGLNESHCNRCNDSKIIEKYCSANLELLIV